MMERVRILIEGRVQGVGFRYSTAAQAEKLGVGGWVRNLPDGNVEAEIVGPAEAVERMLSWCRHGPAMARVRHVSVVSREAAGESEPPGFAIRG